MAKTEAAKVGSAQTPRKPDRTGSKPSRRPAVPPPPPAARKALLSAADSGGEPPAEPAPVDADPPVEQGQEQPAARRRPWRWVAPPSWAVSAALHCGLLLVLALWTMKALEETRETELVASVQTEDEQLDVIDIQIEELELQEFAPIDSPDAVPGAADFGDVSLESQLVATDVAVGPVQESTVGEIGLLFGKDGQGMAESGPGEGVAYFFGVKTKGQRFVFVVDNSNSMAGGKFETAVAELQKSIGRLNEHQQFFVIFFSDTAYPLFYPQNAKGLVPATDDNKRRLEYWLMTVERCLQTRGLEAMQLAFALRPDAIYLLGDGAFTDKTTPQLLATPPGGVTIHTLGFRMNPQAEGDFREIAKRFGGKFTEVKVTPEMVARSRQLNRPRNRTRNGVWGIRLGAAK